MREMEMTKRHSSARTVVLFACVLTLLASLFACENDEGSIKHPGTLRLSLKMDTTSVKDVVTTKAVADEFSDFVDENAYSVQILKGEDVVQEYARYDKMPEELVLEEGSYTIKAFKGDDKPAAFLNPYFAGSTEFVIKEGMSTPLEITCKLANARVTVNYSDDFKEAYPTYNLKMNTEFMKDSLNYSQTETRAAYLQTGEEGTDLNLLLTLVRLEDTVIHNYAPDPIAIKPQEKVNLLFKTDGEALSGISLVVTLNNSLDGDSTLNMDIPEYTYKPVKEPTLTLDNFIDIKGKSYNAIALEAENYYLTYQLPGGVGKCVLAVIKNVKGEDPVIEQYDLTTSEGASAAHKAGFVLAELGDPTKTYKYLDGSIVKGHIQFANALSSLEPSEKEVTYTYKVEMADALPVNPNILEPVEMVVIPTPVTPSVLELSGSESYSILATEQLPNNIVAKYITAAGIKEATLKIERNGILVQTYDITRSLPKGLTFEENKEGAILTFDKSFVSHLDVEPLTTEVYTFTLEAVDLMNKSFEETQSFTVTLEPVFEITIPNDYDIWGWKAKVKTIVSGLTNLDKGNITISISSDKGSVNVSSDDYDFNRGEASWWITQLTPNTKYEIKLIYKERETSLLFTTETLGQVNYGNMDIWSLNYHTNYYGGKDGWLGIGSKDGTPYKIPHPYLDPNKGDNLWTTTNNSTVSSTFGKKGASATNKDDIPNQCFPTVVYEKNNNGLAAVIRSIDASGKNNLARGELNYQNTLASRPFALIFDYSYKPVNNENFEVVVNVIGTTGKVIGTGSRPATAGATDSYKTCKVEIEYSDMTVKAKEVKITFASTTNTSPEIGTAKQVNAPSGENDGTNITAANAAFADYNNVRVGSELRIDNVELIYTEN